MTNQIPEGGEGDSHIESAEVLVGNFEKKPLEVPKTCFVGVALNDFHQF